MLRKIKEYVIDSTFSFTYRDSMIHIINYDDLISMEEERISITYENKRMIIRGQNLIVRKLMDQEVLITGEIEEIELG